MREIFRGLFYETSVKFTDAKYKVLSGYFFLRLVCPALSAAPLQNILPEQRRKLILVAKLIQFIANGNQTSEKESFLNTPSISDFLHRHSDLMVLFFDKILNVQSPLFPLFHLLSDDLTTDRQIELQYVLQFVAEERKVQELRRRDYFPA